MSAVLSTKTNAMRLSKAIPLIAWAFGALIFFRRAFFTGFDKIFGNVGDSRLLVLLHEHWIDVLQGSTSWTSPIYFFPQKGVLGYSDTCLSNAVFYIPLRLAGLDMYAAFQWTLILLSLVGFLGVYRLTTYVVGTPRYVAVLLALTFAFSNNLYLKAGHSQMFAIYWIPLVLLALARSVVSTQLIRKFAWGGAAGMLFGLVVYSNFYVGWFAAFAALLVAIIFLALQLRAYGFQQTWKLVRSSLPSAVSCLVGFLPAMIPFAITYLPVLKLNGGHSYEEAMSYAPGPGDLINVGSGNIIWGATLNRIFSGSHSRLNNIELSLAITPMLTAVVLLCGLMVGLGLRTKRSTRAHLAISLVACVVMLAVTPVKFGFGSLWTIPWHVVPGAVAIRAINRGQIIGSLVATIAIALSASILRKSQLSLSQRRTWKTLGVAVLLLTVVEQYNVTDSSPLDRSDEMQLIVSTPDPPASCRSFFIVDPAGLPTYQSNLDAMIIAQSKHLPTINGYSGQLPAGWALDPSTPQYLDGVRAWINVHGLTNVCSYDRVSKTWEPITFS